MSIDANDPAIPYDTSNWQEVEPPPASHWPYQKRMVPNGPEVHCFDSSELMVRPPHETALEDILDRIPKPGYREFFRGDVS